LQDRSNISFGRVDLEAGDNENISPSSEVQCPSPSTPF